MQLFRHCRQQQAKFDQCVLDKLGWVRPDLGQLSKVRFLLGLALVWGWGWTEGTGYDQGRRLSERGPSEARESVSCPYSPDKGGLGMF